MLKTGQDFLEGLRDGRVVYVGSERIDDVTRHPAFRNAAHSIAEIYDLKADPAYRDLMSFEEGGERFSAYYLKARSRDDLVRRTECHRKIAEMSYGLLGRSPDYIASFVTGMNLKPELFGRFAGNVTRYYEHMRRNDVYAAHAIVSPQAARDPNFWQKQNIPTPSCRVVREDDDGVVVRGMKMLATGAIIADEVWIGNILPLSPEAKAESITFAVPCNTPGLSLWSRKPLEPTARSEFEAPLTWRFDETDAMVMFDDVKVPWERVFVHNDPLLSRGLYIETPAHAYGNHQSNIRYLVKLQFLVGLASRIAAATGADQVPAVRETLGRLASLEALLAGMVAGQIQAAEEWPTPGYVTYNRRMMYAALNWGVENYSAVVDCVRELCGGGMFQMPADASVLDDPEIAAFFRTYWHTPQMDAVERMKLFRVAWDIVGSEFAGRHLQYEKFFPGALFVVRNHNFREAPWAEWTAMVDGLLARMEPPAPETLPLAAE
ncbi:MAG: 4-hydroxyphenylacetate 3-monooxygenase [Methylobacteriaceae bacterium]|nr:4-hydroxyphenylacetate 3-monooxygenase [Methylobacteriaceae bacterium]